MEKYIINFVIVVTMSCYPTQKSSLSYKNQTNPGKCHLVQRVIELDAQQFAPFGFVYSEFIDSNYKLDVFAEKIGQNSEIIRFYQEDNETFQFIKYNKDTIVKKEFHDLNIAELKEEKLGDYLFLCNEGASDLSTNVYEIKSKGYSISKLWLENGDYDNLMDETNNLEDIFQILSLLQEIRENL